MAHARTQDYVVAVIGAGPRATPILERLAARLHAGGLRHRVSVHVFDPEEPGVGRVWRVDQSRVLLTNTPASDTTVFGDETLSVSPPFSPGPTFLEWASSHASHLIDPPWAAPQASTLAPASHPSRALQGLYYRWAFDRACTSLREVAEVTVHRALVTGLDARPSRLLIIAGIRLSVDVAVLAQGFLDDAPTPEEEALAAEAERVGTAYLPPGAETGARAALLPVDAPVIVRGLGATFFDLLGSLAARFAGAEHVEDGRLLRFTSLPPGFAMLVTSPTGLPKHSQPPAPGVRLRRAGTVSDELDALMRTPDRSPLASSRLLALLRAELSELFPSIVGTAIAGDTPGESGGSPPDQDWHAHVARYLDIERSNLTAPRESVWYAFRETVLHRKRQLSRLAETGGIALDAELAAYLRAAGRVTSGPPASRVSLLLQLAAERRIVFLGRNAPITLERGHFRTTDTQGTVYETGALVEARQAFGHVASASDAALRSLLDAGIVRPQNGSPRSTSLDVDELTFHPLRLDGSREPRLIIAGYSASSVQRGVHQAAVPRMSDPLLAEADRVAERLVELVRSRPGERRLSRP